MNKWNGALHERLLAAMTTFVVGGEKVTVTIRSYFNHMRSPNPKNVGGRGAFFKPKNIQIRGTAGKNIQHKYRSTLKSKYFSSNMWTILCRVSYSVNYDSLCKMYTISSIRKIMTHFFTVKFCFFKLWYISYLSYQLFVNYDVFLRCNKNWCL